MKDERQSQPGIGLFHYFLFLALVALLFRGSMPLLGQPPPLIISSISPNSANAGGPAFILTVNGSGFGFTSDGPVPTAGVYWNGVQLASTFVNSNQVIAAVPASNLTVSGNFHQISVTTPNGTSNSVNFTVLPVISSFSPPSVVAGGSSFVLTINGAGFVGDGGDIVRWNDSPRPNIWLSTTQLQVTVPASDIASGGIATITVTNAFAQPQLTSAPASFTISNPTPNLANLSPNSRVAGSSAFTLTVNGANFVPASVVRWNGSNRNTTFVSGTQLLASISASDVASPGNATVVVNNPAPGGGTSSSLSLSITIPRFTVVPNVLNFGDVIVGSTVSRTLTISNQEAVSVQLSASTSAGSPYVVSPTTVSLAPNGSATATIRFTPPAATSYDALASFLVPGAGGETVVSLSGRGVSSLLTFQYTVPGQTPVSVVSGGTIPLPSADVGGSSSIQFQVSNPGPPPASIASIGSNSALFPLANLPSLPQTLTPNGSLSFSIRFQPTAAGSASGTLSINNSAFTLSGIGIVSPLSYRYIRSGQGPVTVSAGGIVPLASVAVGSTSSIQFEISNPSTGPISVSPISSSSPVFSLVNLPALPVTVPGGGSINFGINFTPPLPAPNTATLTVGSRTFSLTGTGFASGITLAGLTDILAPAQQPRVGVDLAGPFSVPITGQIVLTFTPNADVPSDDPAVQFATGGRVVNFTIPANGTRGQFSGGAPDVAFSTGTVAGSLRFAVSLRNGADDVTPVPDPGRTVTVDRRAPTITNLTIGPRTASSFEIIITGFSTPRSLTQANFRFSPRSGSNVQGGDITLPVSSQFTTWYQNSASQAFGSQFRLTVPFTVQGDINAIGSVSVTLTNAAGTSAATSANF